MTGRVEWVASPMNDEERRAFEGLLPYCGIDGPAPKVRFDTEGSSVLCWPSPDRARAVTDALARAEARARGVVEMSPTVLHDQWDIGAAAGGRSKADQVELGEGIIAGGPLYARLMLALDAEFRAMAQRLGAVDVILPHLVTTATLRRANYTGLFPQHLVPCGIVRRDLATLDRVATSGMMDWDDLELRSLRTISQSIES